MPCPDCQHENPADSAFCEGCGARLARACPSCGAETSPAARFCRRCGAAVGPESARAPSPEAEHRQLSVLFCDLVDSTRLAAGLDPEDWREVVRRYQEAAAGGVDRFDGHVAQYLGDGIVAYFGWPRAHEDDAERAVRAALAMVEAVGELAERLAAERGVGLAVRIGVHTGPVVVGELGAGRRRETLALGHTTNVAARLQSLAEPGRVVLSAATLRLVQGIFVTRDLGEHALKGLDEPVCVYQAIRPSGVRSRLDLGAAVGLTPLIGREADLELLADRFAQAREGSGQAVLVAGEAGIGKSRLVLAFRERIAEQAHTWLECRATPYTQESAFYPVLELQRQGLGFAPEDPPERKLDAIEGALAAAGLDVAANAPLLAAFHGVALGGRHREPRLGPEGRRKQTLALLVEWLLRFAREQPVVLLLEDLHWMDPSTLELLGQILERIPGERVLLLATYRPDFVPPWGQRPHLAPLQISRLTRAQLADLVRKAARERDLPDPWVEEIVRRSDGVPLFAEELTRTVVESHAEPPRGGEAPTLRIPETLQDSLTARLDALGPAKELAQLGSVLGREFSYRLLLEVSPVREADLRDSLAQAVREELFYQRGRPPGATYLFKHALVRDAAYQSMLRSTRQRHHRRVAETLVGRMPGVAEEQPELVAQHWTEAGDAARAITWWQRAGERSIARAAYEEAIAHLRRGLGLVPASPEGRERERGELALQHALARALTGARGYGHAETLAAYERARALLEPGEDPLRVVAIVTGVAAAHVSSGAMRSALEDYTQLLALADEAGELARIAAHEGRGFPLFYLGEFRASRDAFDRALAIFDPERHDFLAAGFQDDEGVTLLGWSSWCDWFLGLPDRAWRTALDARALAARRRHPVAVAFADAWASVTASFRGDWETTIALGEAAASLAAQQGLPLLEAVGGMSRAFADGFASGDPSAYEQWLMRAAATGNQAGAPWILGNLSELQLRAQRPDVAEQVVAGALAVAEQTDQHLYDAELHRLKGETALAQDQTRTSEAEECFRRALEIAAAQEAKSLELRAAASLARLRRDQGGRGEARDLLAPVYGWFTEGSGTRDLADAKALLDELR